jgi:predicted ArsR family transcriptional regulator
MTKETAVTYPNSPGFRVPGPSEDAANAITPLAAVLRDQVREVIATHGPDSITADDIAHILNRSVLSVRPRVSELHREGDIRPSGTRGRNASGMTATQWVLTDTSADTCPEVSDG